MLVEIKNLPQLKEVTPVMTGDLDIRDLSEQLTVLYENQKVIYDLLIVILRTQYS